MFLQCGEKYRLHYQERLRSPIFGSPLFLGGAFDEALGSLLLKYKPKAKRSEEEQKLAETDHYTILDNELLTKKYNGEDVYLPTYRYAKYFSKDFNPELLNDEDLLFINSTAHRLSYEEFTKEGCEDFVASCKAEIKTSKALDNDAQVLFNLIHWCCCRRKLRFLLEKYEEDVIPLLEEVYSVQKKVELQDGDHNLIGYIDFVASFKDEAGVKYILDNKLASKAYPANGLDDAVQLATYCEHEGTNKAGFIVTEKGLRKRDPIHRIQILRGELSEELFERTFDQFSEVVYDIEQGVFEKTGMDGTRQECFHFGQRCPYYNTCREEPEKDFLVKLKEK
jgi:hypothetical protein